MGENVIHIVCRLHCASENSNEVEKLVKELVAPSLQEEGCVYYRAFRENEKIGSFFLEDGWQSNGAIEKHLRNPTIIRIMEKLEPLLLHKPEIMYGEQFG